MALSRRTGARFQASIWPGFVDAMTGLLLVLMFVLTIFMIVQFVLTERISGQETELDALAGEVAALADALGLEEQETAALQGRIGTLSASLSANQELIGDQRDLIASLSDERAAQAQQLAAAQTQITSFEAQVAALLSDRADARSLVAELQSEQATLERRNAALLTEQEALSAALARSREETDAQSEVARLAAARREALQALVADLRARNTDAAGQITALEAAEAAAQAALSDEEAARIAESAATQALRARLESADTELTAMTLSLEAQRKRAEETLTLLAAARVAERQLDAALATALGEAESLKERLGETEAEAAARKATLATALAAKLAAEEQAATTLSEAEQRAALLEQAETALSEQTAITTAAQRQTELLNQQVAALRAQLGDLQGLLDNAVAEDAVRKIELQSLGSQLNTALARVAAEESRRADAEAARAELEAAERKRLEAETQDLARYRSEFFGRLRDVLGAQAGVRIEGDRFVFSSEVLFPPGGAVISADGRREIAKVAAILSNVAAEIPPEIDWVIRVDGHTDNQPLSGFGEFADNWELSQARALSVVKYMSQQLGIPPGRLSANGFGQYQPVAAGDSDEARARNRRIELKFTEK